MEKVTVLVAYDLGGRIRDSDKAKELFAEKFESVDVDKMGLKSFNLSYINWHDQIIRLTCDGILLPSGHRATRLAYVYPWLGVVHVELTVHAEQGWSPIEALEFYESFVDWKNRDYLPYLREAKERNGSPVMRTSLKEQSAQVPPQSRHNTFADVIVPMRDLLQKSDLLTERPQTYYFHDYRMIFETSQEASDFEAEKYSGLLGLLPAELQCEATDYSVPASTSLAGISLYSSGWVTVIRKPPGKSHDEFANTILSLARLTHVQWYICQVWLYILGSLISSNTDADDPDTLYRLADSRRIFDTDLTEVGNANVMLKDPYLISIADCLARGFGVSSHRKAAERHFESVAHAEQQRMEVRRQREATTLQLLFALSAAVAVALMIPELWGTSWTLVALTMFVGLMLLIGIGYRVRQETKRYTRKHRT